MKKNKVYQGTTTLEVLEGADNYNKWIADTIKQWAEPPVIEFGAGTGNISEHFLRMRDFTITEVDKSLLKILQGRYSPNANVNYLDLTRRVSPHLRQKYNSAFAVNVFEHIKDDAQSFKFCRETLRRGGRLIILVPAKKFAYTRLDKNLGHYRRYEPEELREKLHKAGFQVDLVKYFNMAGLLSWILRDKLEKQHMKLDRSQIELFDKAVPFLRKIETYIPVPTGISLIAVAKNE